MKVTIARGVIYGIIGVAALAAIRFTPPIMQDATTATAGSLSMVSLPLPANATPGTPMFRSAPVVVSAERLQGVDTIALEGTIHSSLYAALDHTGTAELSQGQRRSLAWRLADIFEHRIDMSRDLMDGDQFKVLVERLQQPNGKVIINKILGAKLALSDGEFEAVHFKSRNSNSEWFDGAGKSLTTSFLRAPLEFRRISSVFGLREHPLFGGWRNHTGTDYAAPMGTPVRAIGDGVVVAIGPNGGYGNMIDIRHGNGFISRYGHMSRFAGGLHRGSHVTMGQTIGYVGMTGWATGPHLHFEIRVNGVARDPKVALQNRTGEPLSPSEERLFQEIREHTMAALGDESGENGERLASSVTK